MTTSSFTGTRRELRVLQALQAALMLSVLVATIPFFGSAGLVPRFAIGFGGMALVLVRMWGFRSGRWPAIVFVGASFPLLAAASIAWSWGPLLTTMKATLLVAVFVTGTLGGLELGRRCGDDAKLLLPWAACGVFWALTALAGFQSGVSFGQAGFRGGTGNENMFASGAAVVAFPLSEYLRRSKWAKRRGVALLAEASPWIWAGLILLSRSRGGLLTFLTIASCWWWVAGRRRKLPWLFPAVLGLLALGMAFGSESVSERVMEIVYKRQESRDDVFSSRRENWLETEAAIAMVGPLGAGFGIAADQPVREDELSWTTTVGYGREHGSTWLALREQLGVAGQAAYAILGLGILYSLALASRASRRGLTGLAAPLLFATALGLFMASMAEAWAVAPGSAESGFFWVALGQAAGAMMRSRSQGRLVLQGRTASRPAADPRVALR